MINSNFLLEYKDATFFHTSMWLETVKFYWGMDYDYEFQFINGKKVILPLSVYQYNGTDFYFSTFKGYGGYLSDSSLSIDERRECESKIQHKYQYFKMRDNPLNPFLTTVAPVITNDFTYIVQRKNRGEKVHRSHRRNIAKAKENNINCRQAMNRKEWEQFYQTCYLDTVKKWNNPSIIYRFDILEHLSQYNNVFLYIAEWKKEIVAGVVVLTFNRHAHCWLSGINQQHKEKMPLYMLIHDLIEGVLDEEVEYLDLGVSGMNDNLRFFKRGFGAISFTTLQYATTNIFKDIKDYL